MTIMKLGSSWHISSDFNGLRVDQYLTRRVGRISRARAQKIIKAKDFLLDGQEVKLSFRVKEGQVATLFRFAPDEKEDVHKFNVEKIYENEDFLVVNKPYGLSIHPSANCLYKTLTHWLRVNYPGQKLNPCHRIDKETSGLVVCAKNRKFESSVKKQFMQGQVKKAYLAIVSGCMSEKKIISLPLGLQRGRGLVSIKMIHDFQGKEAQTVVKPVKFLTKTNRTLVLCKPLTGRQHQIRAHLALIGHGIVGDKLYSAGEKFFDAWTKREVDESSLEHHRHALHARALSFCYGNKNYRFTTKIPKDFFELF